MAADLNRCRGRCFRLEKAKPLFLLGFGILLIGAYLVAYTLGDTTPAPKRIEITELLQWISHIEVSWNPVTWLVPLLQEGGSVIGPLTAILSLFVGMTTLSYFSFSHFYYRGYPEIRTSLRRGAPRIRRLSRSLLSFLPKTYCVKIKPFVCVK